MSLVAAVFFVCFPSPMFTVALLCKVVYESINQLPFLVKFESAVCAIGKLHTDFRKLLVDKAPPSFFLREKTKSG
jgi:hypothetical protein